jgi:hypothetical protein
MEQLPETRVRTPSVPATHPSTIAPSFRDPQSPHLFGRSRRIGKVVAGEPAQPQRISQRPNKGKPPARFLGIATTSELLDSTDWIQWEQAMKYELQSLEKHRTWDLVDLPPRKSPLTGKWVLKKKLGPNGSLSRYKAR